MIFSTRKKKTIPKIIKPGVCSGTDFKLSGKRSKKAVERSAPEDKAMKMKIILSKVYRLRKRKIVPKREMRETRVTLKSV